MSIKLYAFQSRGLERGRELYRERRRSVLFVGPTGMGKTTLASSAAVGRIERGGSVVAVAHRRELVVQMAERLTAMDLDVGYHGRRPGAPVQVVSVQSVLARREIPAADFAILDEAHHYVSDEWIIVPRTLLERGAKIMGLTATPERDDNRSLGLIFDGLVVVAQVAELVELNAINPMQGITPIDVIDPVARVRSLAVEPVDAYEQWAPGRSAVVFAPNVLNAELFLKNFRARGHAADIVHGELKTEVRDERLARFACGELRVLVNVAVLTEGWDAPICDVCILARKIGSLSLLYQCVGRARRPYGPQPTKRALLIDLAGNVELHGPGWHPDDELDFSGVLNGEGVGRSGRGSIGPRLCRVCRRNLTEDLERDPDLTHCPDPDCKTPISKIRALTPEEVELRRAVRDEQRARAPLSQSTKALVTMYANGIRQGHKRGRAERAWLNMFAKGKRLFAVPTEVRVPAWKAAIELVAEEKGDAWTPPHDRTA